jgi:hypothetical protein
MEVEEPLEDCFMKLLTALIALLFFSAISQAQIPFYESYANLQPYYPGTIAPPYYPQAYYPQPYVLQPGYTPYPANQFVVYENRETVDALQRRVQQLTEEVRLLQDRVTATDAQLDAQVQAQQSKASPPAVLAPPVVLVLKNGQRIESRGYAIAGDTLWIITPSGTERILLSNLNVEATQSENWKRGIEFPNVGG